MSSDQVTARQLQQLKSRLQELRSSIVVQLDLSGDRDVPVELDQNRQGRLSRMDALQGQAMLKAGLQLQIQAARGGRCAAEN